MPDHVRSYSEKLARIRPDIKVQAMPDQVAKKVPQVKTYEFLWPMSQISHVFAQGCAKLVPAWPGIFCAGILAAEVGCYPNSATLKCRTRV